MTLSYFVFIIVLPIHSILLFLICLLSIFPLEQGFVSFLEVSDNIH